MNRNHIYKIIEWLYVVIEVEIAKYISYTVYEQSKLSS